MRIELWIFFGLSAAGIAIALAYAQHAMKRQEEINRKMERLTIIGTTATLAAPHLSPSPDHFEENLIILRHWSRIAEAYIKEGI